jgi:hypothetical protein
MAMYVSWAHTIELLGHTEMSWTPVGHWMRAIPDLLGLSLQVTQRGPKHRPTAALLLPGGWEREPHLAAGLPSPRPPLPSCSVPTRPLTLLTLSPPPALL